MNEDRDAHRAQVEVLPGARVPPQRPGQGRRGRVLIVVVVLVAGAVVAALVVPERLGLAGLTVVAQLIALRGLVGVVLAVAGLTLGVLMPVLLRASRRQRATPRRRRVTVVIGALAVLALLGAGTEASVLMARGTQGLGGDSPAPEVRAGDLVVLVQNTKATLDAEQLATEIIERGAEIVVLPETTEATAARAAALVRSRTGRDLQVLAHAARPTDISSTALLVDTMLGTVGVTATLPGIQGAFIASGTPGAPTITAVHTTSPSGPDLDGWARTTLTAVATCGTSSIVAGDFNATLDHPALRDLGGCLDAGLATGTAGVATWPVGVPRWLGAPIDHVLVDPTVWRVVGTAVLEPPAGTDHRGVEAVLRPVGG